MRAAEGGLAAFVVGVVGAGEVVGAGVVELDPGAPLLQGFGYPHAPFTLQTNPHPPLPGMSASTSAN